MPASVSHPAPIWETSRPVTSTTSIPTCHLVFFVHDLASGTRFLVVIGAEVCAIPPSPTDRHHKTKLTLQAVNGLSLPTYGTRSLTLILGLHRTFRWIYIIADIGNLILGSDLLCHFALLVDVKSTCLLDTTQLHPKVCSHSRFHVAPSHSSLLLHHSSMSPSRSSKL